MDYVLKLLKNEKQKLKNDRRMFKLALTKKSLESRDKIDSKISELERALSKLSNDNAALPLQRVSFSTAALDMTTEERELKSAELRHTLRGNCRAEVCPNCGELRPKHYQGEGSCESCAQ